MRTITWIGYRRPEYSHQSLSALFHALEVYRKETGADYCERIVLSVDGLSNIAHQRAHAKTLDVVWAIFDTMKEANPGIELEVISNKLSLGVAGHPYSVLEDAFEHCGSTYNLHLEDDLVLSPDALLLADWYESNGHANQYACLCLYGDDPNLIESDHQPEKVVSTNKFQVWGWATTYRVWRSCIKPTWNEREEEPIGWDCSLEFALRERFRLQCLQPLASRVTNIGREDGVHSTPENWDEQFGGQRAATGIVKEFRFIGR